MDGSLILSVREIYYDDNGKVMVVIDLAPNSDCVAVNIPLGQWHSVEIQESGTVIMETKDGAYEPLGGGGYTGVVK